MKTIKEQYINLTEGKLSEAQFLRNVRLALPQFITNVNNFKDTVKILKNKGIISEEKITDQTINQGEFLLGLEIETDGDKEKIEKVKDKVIKNIQKQADYYTRKVAGKVEGEKDSEWVEVKKKMDSPNQMKKVKLIKILKEIQINKNFNWKDFKEGDKVSFIHPDGSKQIGKIYEIVQNSAGIIYRIIYGENEKRSYVYYFNPQDQFDLSQNKECSTLKKINSLEEIKINSHDVVYGFKIYPKQKTEY